MHTPEAEPPLPPHGTGVPDRASAEPPVVPWRGRDAAYVAIAYVLVLVVSVFLLRGISLGVFLLLAEIPLGVITLLWARRYRGSRALLGPRFRFGGIPVLAGIGLGFLLMGAQIAISLTAVMIRGSPPPRDAGNIPDLSGGALEMVLLVAAVVFVGPVVEELFFRGLLLQGLLRSFRRWTAVLVSSLLFALPHIVPSVFGSVVSLLATFAVGIGVAWVFIWSRNLAIPIVAHAAFNGIVVGIALALSSEA
jgi:membrane protease YdiL (CAAX protease family)